MLTAREDIKATDRRHERADTIARYGAIGALPFDPATVRAELGAGLADGDDPGRITLERMRRRLEEGRGEIALYFERGGDAEIVHRALAEMMDCLVQGALDFAERHLYRLGNPTRGEEVAVLAVGGYGRGELAPYSDIDLLVLIPYKRTPYQEQLAEFVLLKLWDLGLKVGHAMRSVDECLKLAARDVTVRTTLLEARQIWGSPRLGQELLERFRKEVCAGREPEFVEAKLAERDERHHRLGDSRYFLEPNLKEGKGGLRDLHTLMWIGRFAYGVDDMAGLVGHGVLDRAALKTFQDARRFLWTVRCHLHYLAKRPEERLTFDMQARIAERMGFRERAGTRSVERFMKRYYLVAKDVGALTRIVCAALEEQLKRKPRFTLQRLGMGRRYVGGFVIQGRRAALEDPELFRREPVKMLELFHLAQMRSLDIHPLAMTAVTRNLKQIDRRVREDPAANRRFIEILTSRRDPVKTLTWMNEAGLLGRFVPDFGRVVAQMQHDLYHVYTVDEHTIQAIGVLAQIERGELGEELPLATGLMPQLLSREELYVAVFLHDLGKGRGGDHSEIGAAIARRVCPRLGLSEESTETVEWLVRHHLFMSGFAFKRDLEDPKTIQDFVDLVQSPERLRLLLVLTAADIRAVAPGAWNGWKGQLLRELYYEAEAVMASGDIDGRRQARIDEAKVALRHALLTLPERPWSRAEVDRYISRHHPRYWLAVGPDAQLRHAELVRSVAAEGRPIGIDFQIDQFRARTELMLYAADNPGLFMKVAGALALSGVSIVDARIFTTADGMALDTLGCQDAERRAAVTDPARLDRIRTNIEKTMAGELALERELSGRRWLPARADVFKVEPRVLVNNQASRTHSVVEVNGRDRPGLLFDVARAIKDLGLVIHSAHVSTYGERVVDVFYVKDVFGMKVTSPSKLKRVREHLRRALEAG